MAPIKTTIKKRDLYVLHFTDGEPEEPNMWEVAVEKLQILRICVEKYPI